MRSSAPVGMGSVARPPRRHVVLSALAIVAACAAMVMLARQADDTTLDYAVGIVPALVPWAAACLSIGVAVWWHDRRGASPAAGSLLLGGLLLVTAWSVVMLPFDALRLVGLVPLPISEWGAATRLVLLVAGAAALVPALRARQTGQVRCPVCRRVLPGRLDRWPRWPVGVAVVAALVYPALRTIWALGGTFGTAGEPLVMDSAVAWGTVIAGASLVAVATILFAGTGPLWARAVLGLGGIAAGFMLVITGGLATVKAASTLATEGFDSVTGDLMTWTFVVVYASWFVAGIGIIVGGWRYWAHRRDGCSGCRTMLGAEHPSPPAAMDSSAGRPGSVA